MSRIDRTNRVMALAVVAMFLISAIGVIQTPTADAGDYDEKTYTINMHSNDTFSYTPTTNYDTAVFSYSGYNQTGLGASVSNSTFTVTNPAAGTSYTNVTITASVTTPTEQSVHQYLDFDVYDRLSIKKGGNTVTTDSIYVPQAVANGSTVATYSLSGTGPSNATWSESHTVKLSGANSDKFSVSFSNNTWTIAAGSSIPTGDYTVTLSRGYTMAATATSNAIEDSTTATITIHVTANPGITPGSSYAIAGTATTQTVTTNGPDNFNYTGWSLSGVPSAHSSKISIDTSSGSKTTTLRVTDDFSNSDISSGDSVSIPFTINLGYTANGTEYTSSSAYTLTVYKALCFTSTPTSGTITPVSSSADPTGLDVAVWVSTLGATKITYDWGDGTVSVRDVLAINDTIYGESHTYERPGTYFISATSENDFGKTTSYTMYTCGSEMAMNTLKSSEIRAESMNEGKDVRLSVYPIVAGNYTDIKYTWMYKSSNDAEPIALDGSNKPSFVKEVGTALVLDKEKTPANTTFYAKISVKFQYQENWTDSDTVSYKLQDTSFFAEHGYLFLVFLAMAIILLVLWFFFGFTHPAVMAGVALCAVLAILLYVNKDFNGIVEMFKGLFKW